jgi:hypothetical protein
VAAAAAAAGVDLVVAGGHCGVADHPDTHAGVAVEAPAGIHSNPKHPALADHLIATSPVATHPAAAVLLPMMMMMMMTAAAGS